MSWDDWVGDPYDGDREDEDSSIWTPYEGGREDEDPPVWVSYVRENRETLKARLFILTEPDDFAEPPVEEKSVWLPKSQILDDDAENKRIEIPQWLADKNGL
jgi:hypothetical protein